MQSDGSFQNQNDACLLSLDLQNSFNVPWWKASNPTKKKRQA